MNKENNKILPNQKVVSMITVGGISAIVTTNGVIETNRKITPEFKKRIENELSGGLENILDGWIVEGEYKNGAFFVRYIMDEKGKVLDVYDTKSWAGIMNFGMMSYKQFDFKDIKDSRENIRPVSSFMGEDINYLTIDSKKSWRKKINEVIGDVSVLRRK